MELRDFEIKEITNLTKGNSQSHPIYSFKLVPVNGIMYKFRPGQFITIFSEDEKLFRSYSIASPPESDFIELFIEMINGKMTSYLSKKKEGDVLKIGEPRGTFLLDEKTKSVYLAAGVGIAPFFSILRHSIIKKEPLDSYLFYSVKHVDDIILMNELKSFEGIGLRILINVTRDQKVPEHFLQGRISMEKIKKFVPDYLGRKYYICGGLTFAKDLKASLIKEGISEDSILSDIWGEN